MKFKIISIAILCIALYACKKNAVSTDYAASAVCSGTTPTYTNYVSSIINNSCATSGCHNNASSKAGISLEGFANASNQFKTNSKNLTAIHYGSGVEAMPKSAAKLADSIINKLDCWVKNGCPQ
jgi:hypothetical protein